MSYIIFLSLLSTILASAVLAAEIRVSNGESIQDAVDAAVAGDTIIVGSGTYTALHITKSNIRLVGEPTNGIPVVIYSSQYTYIGIFVAPPNCEYDAACDTTTIVSDIDIVGITVYGGIETRRVDKFSIQNCYSRPFNITSSTNGLLQGNFNSAGEGGIGMSCSGCENVSMLDNELYNNNYGIHITVSNNVVVRNNVIYNNFIGIGLLHPDYTRTPQLPVMKNWIIEENNVYDNNLSRAPYGGYGILLVGVSNHIVRKNTISNNGIAGAVITDHCTYFFPPPADIVNPCGATADPFANNNLISRNTFQNNGNEPAFKFGSFGIPGVDLLYLLSRSSNEIGDGNCFVLKLKTTYFVLADDFSRSGRLGQSLPNGCGLFPGFFGRWLNRLFTFPDIIFRLLFRTPDEPFSGND